MKGEIKVKAIKMNPKDNVATAIDDIKSGEVVGVKNDEVFEVQVLQEIPFGHKFALKDISKGEAIVKYGEVIGRATAEIRKGEHVHVHNVESLRGRGDLKK
ncbi:MAG: altronate dehydratase small subunit [Archaeoglobi archaeon]|nr:altronate dehydratase small subunit [Archaeoglobi archaeon]